MVRGKELKSSTEFVDYCKKVKETFENQDPFDEDYQLKFPKITRESWEVGMEDLPKLIKWKRKYLLR